MPSLKTTLVLAATIISTLAQTYLDVDPNSVPLATRQGWCRSQTSTCPELCRQLNSTSYTANDCDPKTLSYSCVCGNGMSPNASEFSLTLPYFLCTEQANQCVTACKSDNTCASSCRQDHPCGAQDPVRVNTTEPTSTSTSASKSATATGNVASETVVDGFADGSGSGSNSKNAGNTVMVSSASYSLAVICAGVFAGLALL